MNNQGFNTVFNITDFGAVADGKSVCTQAFVAAVKSAVNAGGGKVYVPAGRFITGPIHLQSNITLEVDAGAVLLFSQDPADYPLVFTRWEGVECDVYSPLIYGANLENVAIVGRGVLDGQGSFWWKAMREQKLEYPRPRFISFEHCQNVLIEGVKLINSPAWTINPIRCENVTIHKLTIINPADSPNTDGIDPDSCKNVHIANCHVDVGDDCITIKSGSEDCPEKVACENITVTNCTMMHGHGGVVIGSEMSGGVRNVVISNCIFEGTDRGIRIKSRRGRGGIVEDIRVNNIVMKKVICPIVMHKYYSCGQGGEEKRVWDKNPYPVDETTPVFRGIHLSNITAREVSAAAGFLYGLSESPISDITLDNISIHLADNAQAGLPAMMSDLEPMKKQGFFCCNVANMTFHNVTISNHQGVAFQIVDSRDVVFSLCAASTDAEPPLIQLDNTAEVLIQVSKLAKTQKTFLIVKGVRSAEIEITGKHLGQDQISLEDGATCLAVRDLS